MRKRQMSAFGSRAAALVLALCLSSPATAADHQPRIGRISALEGSAIALGDDGARTLATGDPVFLDDRLITPAGAALAVRFDDGTEMILGAGCTVALETWDPEAGRGLVALVSGILRLVTDPAARWLGLAVETRQAVASARSTDWIVETGPGATATAEAEATSVFVSSGRVAVTARSAEVVLGAGEGVDVTPATRTLRRVRWSAERIAAARARLSLEPRDAGAAPGDPGAYDDRP